ncbi:hypothetical protein AB0392_16630 [Nonomuraea angiospora]|uniref:hypothetical protein n=1 Tax=Nonomuraea angiospora TaxID=46172 RepID=UPI00344F6495
MLDYLRQYPWHSAGGIVLLATVLSIVLLFIPDKSAEIPAEEVNELPGPSSPAGLTSHADFSHSTIIGNVVVAQGGQSSDALAEQSYEELPEAEPGVDGAAGRLVFLYAISTFLGTGGWEEAVWDAVVDAAPNAECLPLDPTTPKTQGVSAVIVLVSAAQFGTVKRKMVPRLKAAQPNYPAARIILIAAGRSEEPFKEQDGHSLAKSAGYPEECTRVLVCPTIDALREELASHIRIVVRTGMAQARLGISVQGGDVTKGAS